MIVTDEKCPDCGARMGIATPTHVACTVCEYSRRRSTLPPDKCATCGRIVEAPRKYYRDGVLYECCVDTSHDPYVVGEEHAAFVARARAAGIDGDFGGGR